MAKKATKISERKSKKRNKPTPYLWDEKVGDEGDDKRNSYTNIRWTLDTGTSPALSLVLTCQEGFSPAEGTSNTTQGPSDENPGYRESNDGDWDESCPTLKIFSKRPGHGFPEKGQ